MDGIHSVHGVTLFRDRTHGCPRRKSRSHREYGFDFSLFIGGTRNTVAAGALGAGLSDVGFIAEDVPELVATKDRKAMSAMDVVAVLTKAVQEQQDTLEEQQRTISELKKMIKELKEEKQNK